jgi:hypothetical protein
MKKQAENRQRVQLLIWCLVVLAVAVGVYLWYSRAVAAPAHNNSPSPNPSQQVSPQATPQTATTVSSCNTTHLAASLAPASSAAGTSYETLTLTNTGSSACTVMGYPGVSLLSETGAQLGQPATRDTVTSPGEISLQPKQSAYSNVGFPDPGNFGSGQCSSPALTIRIYPPDQTAALTAPASQQYCPGFAVTALSSQLQ